MVVWVINIGKYVDYCFFFVLGWELNDLIVVKVCYDLFMLVGFGFFCYIGNVIVGDF